MCDAKKREVRSLKPSASEWFSQWPAVTRTASCGERTEIKTEIKLRNQRAAIPDFDRRCNSCAGEPRRTHPSTLPKTDLAMYYRIDGLCEFEDMAWKELFTTYDIIS